MGSGLAYSSGRGQNSVFGLTSAADRERLSGEDTLDATAQMAWLCIATGRAETRGELGTELALAPEVVSRALAALFADERVADVNGKLVAQTLHIPVGSEQGWEVAVSDHFRAMASAIIAKLRVARSEANDRVGGATLAFTVPAGHPFEEQVYGLLERTRRDVNALWNAVTEYNRQSPPPESAPRVTFYFGQNVTGPDTDEPTSKDPQ